MKSNHKVSYIASSVAFVSASAKMSSAEEEVFANIGKLTLEQLVQVYVQLGLPDLQDDQKTKGVVLKLIRRFLSSDTVEISDDKGLAHFMWIQTFMESANIVDVKTEPTEHAPIATSVTPTSGTPAPISVATAAITTTVPNAGQGLLMSNAPAATLAPSRVSLPTASVDLADLKKALKKDFKIQGSIGIPGSKGTLTFSSIAFKINNGVKKGYTEEEIIEEVVRVISPDISLRGLLEGRVGMTLPILKKMLRSHYEEAGATSLYNQLTQLSQGNDQRPQDFVVDLMNLSQVVLFVSSEEGSKVSYPESLVRHQLMQGIVTGLRNVNIRNDIKPVLTANPGMEDEDILQLLNQAISDEKERKARMKETVIVPPKKASAAANQVNSHDAPVERSEKKDHNPILKELREMREAQVKEIGALKGDIQRLEQRYDSGQAVNRPKRTFNRFRCETCIQNGARKCTHCFKCGKTDHKKPDCPENN